MAKHNWPFVDVTDLIGAKLKRLKDFHSASGTYSMRKPGGVDLVIFPASQLAMLASGTRGRRNTSTSLPYK